MRVCVKFDGSSLNILLCEEDCYQVMPNVTVFVKQTAKAMKIARPFI